MVDLIVFMVSVETLLMDKIPRETGGLSPPIAPRLMNKFAHFTKLVEKINLINDLFRLNLDSFSK